MKQGCYKEGAATKSYSVSQTHGTHNKQKAFQETERFKELSKERYKIEAKNADAVIRFLLIGHPLYGIDRKRWYNRKEIPDCK